MHYDVISAFIKSMRGSDPDASVYYLALMLEAGEDPLFIARRVLIFASEDIGLEDSNALSVALAAYQSLERLGMPEGRIVLSHAVLYCALAKKNNDAYASIDYALSRVRKGEIHPVKVDM
jgi:putative ATPase